MSGIEADRAPARHVMIGGFLGAGKTTAVARLARHLADRGRRVGLICNDQSTGLVDTKLLRSKGFPVEEITGGCFCCRFNSLLEAAANLTRDIVPDVFISEPVGSCTDLVATVTYPLRRIYGDRFSVAPLSVLVDPARAARILGLEPGRTFSEKVVYVYRKQLEEADAIVINKCDTLDAAGRDRLRAAIRATYPRAEIFCCSVRDGIGLDPWFTFIESGEARDADPVDVDYDIYADGEARLGWLNATVRLEAAAAFDVNEVLSALARDIRDSIAAAGGSIAHLKMTLDTADEAGLLSAVSLVGSDAEPELRESLLDTLDRGVLVINLRAEADPDHLAAAMHEALRTLGGPARSIRSTLEHVEQLRPGRPEPTHRMTPEDRTPGKRDAREEGRPLTG